MIGLCSHDITHLRKPMVNSEAGRFSLETSIRKPVKTPMFNLPTTIVNRLLFMQAYEHETKTVTKDLQTKYKFSKFMNKITTKR